VVSPGWEKLQPQGMKTKTSNITGKITLHTETKTLFIISPFYRPAQSFIVRAAQNAPLYINSLYKLPELLSTKKRIYIGPEICGEERIFRLLGELDV
jgi:hypothetical protein